MVEELALSVAVMLLYLANDAAPSGFYPTLAWLYVITAAITLWLMRVWLLSHRRELNGDPVSIALVDPPSLALGASALAAFALAVRA